MTAANNACPPPRDTLSWMHAAYDQYAGARMCGRPDLALHVCEGVLQSFPDSVEWRLRTARNCLDLGRPDDAVAALDIACRYARCDVERALLNRLRRRTLRSA